MFWNLYKNIYIFNFFVYQNFMFLGLSGFYEPDSEALTIDTQYPVD